MKMLRGTGLRSQAKQWNYEYMDQAPYEIVSNNVMPFTDIIRIKQVEDVLEKYWNDHRMDHGVEYLVSMVYPSPFDFFQEFGSYWEDKNWSRIGHQPEDLFKRLVEFNQQAYPENQDMLVSLLKVDYLENLSFKPRKPWWDTTMTKQEKSPYYQAAIHEPERISADFASLKLNEKDMYKHVLIEEIDIDYSHYQQTGEYRSKKNLVLAYFNPKEGCSKLFFTEPETLLS